MRSVTVVIVLLTQKILTKVIDMKFTVCDGIIIQNDLSDLNKLENCQIIDGSLSIVNISDESIKNFTFPLLTEVTGYLKIQKTDYLLSVGALFPNLALIRGKNLNGTIAMEISDNENLSEIGLIKLQFIGNGNVRIKNNKNLCFAESIDWSVITVKSKENEVEASLLNILLIVIGF